MQTICVTCDMRVAAASVLVKASMLRRWRFQLSAAVAAEIAKGDWLSLMRLDFGRTKLTRAVVHELVAANWPALSYLSLSCQWTWAFFHCCPRHVGLSLLS